MVYEMAIRMKDKELGYIDSSGWWRDFINAIAKGAGFDDLVPRQAGGDS